MRELSRREWLQLSGAVGAAALTGTAPAGAAPSAAWRQTYGGVTETTFSGIEPALDGGYVCSGTQGDEGLAMRIGEGGEAKWSTTFLRRSSAEFSDVAAGDGAYAFVGSEEGRVQRIARVVIVDAAGDISYEFTQEANQNGERFDAVASLDGGYLAAGRSTAGDPESRQGWVVRTTAKGTSQWTRHYGGDRPNAITDLTATGDGGFAFVGHAGDDAWLVRADSRGSTTLEKTYGGDGDVRRFTSIHETDAGYALTGHVAAADGSDRDAWVLAVDGSGAKRWERRVRDPTAELSDGVVSDGAVVGAGHSGGSAWATKANQSGTAWTRTFDRGAFTGVTRAPDGNLVFAGRRGSSGVLVKTGPGGTTSGTSAMPTPDVQETAESPTETESGGDERAGRTMTEQATPTADGDGGSGPTEGGATSAGGTTTQQGSGGVPGFGSAAALVAAGLAGAARLWGRGGE